MLAFENKLLVSSALFGLNRKYRYVLYRTWDVNKRILVWVMLNPSKADEVKNDATIRRCMGFARGWGYGGIEVYNLFAYVATYPEMLLKIKDPIGAKNDAFIRAIPLDREVVIAWGNIPNLPKFSQRAYDVLRLLNRKVHCMGSTKSGNPKHPVRLANVTQLQIWFQI